MQSTVLATDNIANQIVLPHNVELEQVTLGSILLNNNCLEKVSDILKAEYFYVPFNARLFETILKQVSLGFVADPMTIATVLQDVKTPNDQSIHNYLVSITEFAPSIVKIKDYGRQLYSLYLRRMLIELSRQTKDNALESSKDPKDEIKRLENELFNLGEEKINSHSFVPFNELVDSVLAEAINAAENPGLIRGLPTSFQYLDNLLGGLHKTDLIILAGRPGMGKTTFATNIAFNVARHLRTENRPSKSESITTQTTGTVAIFSLEMSSNQLANRILAESALIPAQKFRNGFMSTSELESIKTAAQELRTAPLYIDDSGGLDILDLTIRARRIKRTRGLELIIIDYLQLMGSTSNGRNDNRVLEINRITTGLKALAKELQVPIICLSQLSRGVEQRENKRPQLSDLRDSGAIEQDADIVMFLFRQDYYDKLNNPEKESTKDLEGETDLIIAKNRHGPTQIIKLAFEAETSKFRSIVNNVEQ